MSDTHKCCDCGGPKRSPTSRRCYGCAATHRIANPTKSCPKCGKKQLHIQGGACAACRRAVTPESERKKYGPPPVPCLCGKLKSARSATCKECRRAKPKFCLDCGTPISAAAERCQACSGARRRTPPQEEQQWLRLHSRTAGPPEQAKGRQDTGAQTGDGARPRAGIAARRERSSHQWRKGRQPSRESRTMGCIAAARPTGS